MYKFKKKCIIIITLIALLLTTSISFATENNNIQNNVNNTVSENNLTQESSVSKIVDIKDEQLRTIEDYKAKYGSDTYGIVAYILHLIQWWSIPLGLVGIAVCAIYQYVIGLKRLDIRDKGFSTMMAMITLIIVCQVLPLIFAVVIKSND